MSETMEDLANEMRAAGVRRMAFAGISEMTVMVEVLGDMVPLQEIELFDAPPVVSLEPFQQPDEPEPENKGPGTCIARGCMDNNGWQFDTRYCAPHGRAAAGVKP